MDNTEIELRRRIAAPREVVFKLLTETDQWLRWQGTEAHLDARPGGVHRVNILGDGFASGSFVDVVEPERVSFTWGFEHEGHPIAPGSTLIEITLESDDDGNATILHFRQSQLPADTTEVVRGWEHFLDELAAVAAAE